MRRGPLPSGSRPFIRSGGWIVVAALVFTTAAFAWHIVHVVSSRPPGPRGDGRTVASYGFSLDPCTVPRADILASGLPRDAIQVLHGPRVWTLSELDRASQGRRGKILVPGDRVVGVAAGGRVRAYPLRFLVWHEAVNDTLGGVPVLVTYHPLTGSVAVFSREVGGRVLELSFSGLLYQSCPLLYDGHPGGRDASLWSQLLQAAVTGPAAAAGARLEVLPASVATWREWRRTHPDTTVLAPLPAMMEEYGREPYASYFGSDELRFPVEPLPPHSVTPLKAPVAVVFLAGRRWVVPLDLAAARSGASGAWRTELGGEPVRLTAAGGPAPVAAVCGEDGRPLPMMLAYTFAWYATHAGDPATVWLARPR